MTETERRTLLADMVVDEVKRIMRATSRKLGDGATKAQLLGPALAAAHDVLHKSGAGDLCPIELDLHADPARPDDVRRVQITFSGLLF